MLPDWVLWIIWVAVIVFVILIIGGALVALGEGWLHASAG
jgi:hypothetical protein